MGDEVFYADTELKVAKVVAALGRAAARGQVAGLDTEFYGVDIRSKSVVAEAKLHVLSVGVRRYPAQIHPRGYSVADAAVVPGALLGLLRPWLESSAPKAVHNLPVDAHVLNNEGIRLNGGINTLAMARWAWPGRARGGGGFTLDALGEDLVGAGKTEGYSEIFVQERVVPTVRERRVRICECGATPRRGHPRSSVPGHQRITRADQVHGTRVERVSIPMEEVGPDHSLWPRFLAYAARDALLALYVHEIALREMTRAGWGAPWLAV